MLNAIQDEQGFHKTHGCSSVLFIFMHCILLYLSFYTALPDVKSGIEVDQ